MLRTLTHLALGSFTALALIACQNQAAEQKNEAQTNTVTPVSEAPLNLLKYDLIDVLSCLPNNNTLIAAHRGTSRAWDIPENSLQGLNLLIEAGTLIAEIDVAGLKSGEQILYHDGVWDRKSTGKGPLASTTWDTAETYLLKSYAGTLSSERPPLLSTVLDLAKDKIFLEVDFKSSAKTDDVLRLIRERDMAGQVVLIAYTQERAKELQALAPEMLISAPGEDKGQGLNPKTTLLWMGRNITSQMGKTDMAGYIGLVSKEDNISEKAAQSVFLVSDWPTDYPAIIGEYDQQAYATCLAEK
ncbi:glycerophosphoryl diester phosphodiesterase family protein [Litorimonas taeanensis]|uniref:Glycerophosphoryl diester phosphodiesterase family protein n=1 Tax=Litorimonas taeanensis TaxID=568099 RepID=A0A420WEH7_9PROT|nr:glycerophosphodiester phosphodiesterase family protein [Litorimonas taeanensis]RKQ69439.1 glycerophosphoryl diester phosphodiesterase family protein [Litorimonas taeanensis]